MFYTYYDLKKPETKQSQKPEKATIIHGKLAGVASFYCLKTRRGYYFRSKNIHKTILQFKSYINNKMIDNQELQADFDLYGAQWFRVGIHDEIIKSARESEATFQAKLDSRLFVSLHDKIYNSQNPYNKKDVIIPVIYERSSVDDIEYGRKNGDGMIIQDWRKRRGLYVISNAETNFVYAGYTTGMHEQYARIKWALDENITINNPSKLYPILRRQCLKHGKDLTWEFVETNDRNSVLAVKEKYVRVFEKGCHTRH